MKQKSDRKIAIMEKEEQQLARTLHFWDLLVRQRTHTGDWK